MDQDFFDIHIIATNDMEGALFSTEHDANLLKAATYIKMARRMADDVLLLDNGNHLTGSLSSFYFSKIAKNQRNPIITIMNQLDYDASSISPKDFNNGMKYFNKAQAMANFPYLSANILHHSTKEPYFDTPIIIKEVQGMRIGIIGISSKSLLNSKEMNIADAVQSAKRWIRHLRDKENPDYVIALYNGGLDELADDTMQYYNEAEAIIEATEGIDVMITGHQPATKKIDNTLFIQAGGKHHLCHLKFKFARRTSSYELIDVKSELVDITVYREDDYLKDIVYYEEKMFKLWQEQLPEHEKHPLIEKKP